MGIKVRLADVMIKRGMSLNELSDRVGITLANLSILKNNKARAIRFSTLDGLCRALNCTPGDILEFDENHVEPEDGPERDYGRRGRGNSRDDV